MNATEVNQVLNALNNSSVVHLLLAMCILLIIFMALIVWGNNRDKRSGGDLAGGLIKIMGETNQDIADNVKLSRQAIEQNQKASLDAAKAITDAAALLAKRHEEVLGVLQKQDTKATDRHTVTIDRLDILNALMQDTVQQFMDQFAAHEDNAAERARVLATTIEARFGELVAELRAFRDSVSATEPGGNGSSEKASEPKEA
jgi:hypothetical protein